MPRLRRDLAAMVRAALDACHPARLIPALCARERALTSLDQYWILAAGKAAGPMLDAWFASQSGECRGGVVASSAEHPARTGFSIHRTGHPTPDDHSLAAGRAALALAGRLRSEDTLVVLLSGGASAHLAVPSDGLGLADKVATTRLLLKADATIAELNAVRKHLSAIKGGRLATAAGARVLTLAISDVVGDDPSTIGSGPTVADPTTFADARDCVARHDLEPRLPDQVRARLEQGVAGRAEETPKPGDPRLERSTWHLVGSRADAMRGAATAADRLGYDVSTSSAPLVGVAREAGGRLVLEAVAIASTLRRPACVICSGETVVRVTGEGLGGRNQEVALAAAIALESAGEAIALASVGTDGVDGPTDAAGAIADSTTLARARQQGLAPAHTWLARNDDYRFFAALGDLIATGPTGTNVADLQVVLFA